MSNTIKVQKRTQLDRNLETVSRITAEYASMFRLGEREGWTLDRFLAERAEVQARPAYKKLSRELTSYVRGYWYALSDNLHNAQKIVYGGIFEGRLYTTHRERADYYERNGIAPRDFADDGRVSQRGFYWANAADKGLVLPYSGDHLRNPKDEKGSV